jgi:hypothetical protein
MSIRPVGTVIPLDVSTRPGPRAQFFRENPTGLPELPTLK